MPVYRQSLGGACSIASLRAECPQRSTGVRFDRVCRKSLISLTLLDVAACSNQRRSAHQNRWAELNVVKWQETYHYSAELTFDRFRFGGSCPLTCGLEAAGASAATPGVGEATPTVAERFERLAILLRALRLVDFACKASQRRNALLRIGVIRIIAGKIVV